MRVLQLDVEGLSGDTAKAKAQAKLGAGYSGLALTDTIEVVEALATALYGGSTPEERTRSSFARVRVVLGARDDAGFVLTREPGHSSQLERLAADGSRVILTEDPSEIAQVLRAQLALPPRRAWEGCFVFTPAQLGDSRPSAGRGRGGDQAGRDDASALARRRAALEEELGLSRDVDRLQSRVDELSADLEAVNQKLKPLEALRASSEAAVAAVEAAPTPASLGLRDDIAERLARYPGAVKRLEEAISRLAAEREPLEAKSFGSDASTPLHREPRFVAATLVGVACLAAGAALSGYGRYIALLDIPAFGVAAFLAFAHIDGRQREQERAAKLELYAAREKKLNAELSAEAGPVRAALAKLRLDSPEELVELLGRRGAAQAKADEVLAKLAQEQGAPENVEALARRAQLEQALAVASAELGAKGGYVRDAREVERELAGLLEPPKAEQARPEDEHGRFGVALECAAALLDQDPVALVSLVKERVGLYSAALTQKRFTGVELSGKQVVARGASGPAGLDSLSVADRDLLYLALRLALLERACARVKAPVVVEDGTFERFDRARWPLIGKMLRQFGALTQVLHASRAPDPLAMTERSATF